MGRCEPATGIAPFGRLVKQVLAQEPYTSAERLFWIVDNGSSHRGETSLQRIEKIDSRIILLHTPVHASWLNQVEIYFSIIQRKVLTPTILIACWRLRFDWLCTKSYQIKREQYLFITKTE
jgi:hypothetical protein